MRSFLVLALVIAVTTAKTYDGYQVFRTEKLSSGLSTSLRRLMEEDVRFDFWLEPRTGASAEIMAAPENVPALRQILDNRGIGYTLKVKDVQRTLTEEARAVGHKLPGKNADYDLDWDNYYQHDVINAFLDELAANYDFANVVTIGQSYEGRDMKVIQINKAGEGAPNVWIEAGIHAREWISPAVATYVIRELVENYANHPEYVDKVNYHILPVANPDGYDYTFSDDRLWRKTRSRSSNGCYGVDSNRNFAYEWGGQGTSGNPCSDTYRGEEAFSEVENQHIRDYVLSISPVPTFATAVHSAAELWLYPYGYDYNQFPENVDELIELGDAAVQAIYDTHGIVFVNENSAELYPAAGDSNDWYVGTVGIRWSYTIELRHQGHGFELPPEQIIPSGEEMWNAYKVCFDKVIEVSY